MRISKIGLELIKKFEGFRAEPYLCPADVPTIGYGATYYPNGERVTMQDRPITKNRAESMLRYMLRRYEKGVCRYVKNELNQYQFDALVSFSYNVGLSAFKNSTLLKKINIDPCDENIRHQFSRWVYADGKKLKGLEVRRTEESKLYFL